MSSLRSQAARVIGRNEDLTETFEGIASNQQDLQAQITALNSLVDRLTSRLDESVRTTDELQAELAAMRSELRVVVDDLGDRIGALSARLDEPQR